MIFSISALAFETYFSLSSFSEALALTYSDSFSLSYYIYLRRVLMVLSLPSSCWSKSRADALRWDILVLS